MVSKFLLTLTIKEAAATAGMDEDPGGKKLPQLERKKISMEASVVGFFLEKKKDFFMEYSTGC